MVLSGGLTAHNLGDRTSFSPETAKPIHKEFDAAVHEAMNVEDVSAFLGLPALRGRISDGVLTDYNLFRRLR